MLKDLILQNRSYRRFYQDVAIEHETLRELVDLARYSASGSNRQPLKYLLSCDSERNAVIFPHLVIGRPSKDWHGPPEGERPTAYIIILGDTEIKETFGCEHGIAAQSILLGATERGLGGCMIGLLVKRDELSKALGIPSRYQILLVLILGKPKEKVILETIGPDGDTEACLDSDGIHHVIWWDSSGIRHVPKRRLDDIIIG